MNARNILLLHEHEHFYTYGELVRRGHSFIRNEWEGYNDVYFYTDEEFSEIENHFLEKGFYTYMDEQNKTLFISIFKYNKGVTLNIVKRIEEKDLLYLVFRRFKHLRIFEPLVFRIIKEYLIN